MNPTLVPLYMQSDLARYLGLPISTVASWRSRGGRVPHQRGALLSFEELISLLFVRELLRRHVRLKNVFLAERDLQQRLGRAHPFALERLWVEGGDVLVRVSEPVEGFLAANRAGQATLPSLVEPKRVELPELVRPLRQEVDYSEGNATAWRPAPHIVARPAVQFGLPCVEGSRLPTRTLLRAVAAGDRVDDVAAAYGVDVQDVEAAVGWEQSLAA
jgi:uncharacterized protein (DUF433 family)